MIEWTVGGRDGWYDADAVGQARAAGLAMPVAGRLTSGFGMRLHPILGYSRMHQGLDLAAPWGVPIRAAANGTVSFAGWHGGHGNMVQLAHGGGTGTGYAHMSRIAVSPGEQVTQGQVIGFVGSTGQSTGSHLHFEAYRGGIPVDPRSMSFAVAPLLDGAQLAAFRARLTAITRG